FKSLYQGEYIADVYNGLQYLGTVKILNKLKYKFTEADNYDIITRGYAAKDLKKVRDGISLYRISFPGSDKDKELSFMLMDLAASNGNTLLINEETKYLKDVYQLNEKDKIKLLQIQDKAFGKDLVIDNYFLTYDKSNVYLNSYIKEIILNKGIATDSELQFLEKMYMDSRDPQLAQEISELYLKNGNISKSTYYKGMASTGGIGLVGLGGLTNLSGIPDTSVAQPVSNNNIAPENTSNNLTIGNVNQFNKVFSDGKAALDKENYQEALVFLEKAKTLGNPQEQQTVKFYIGKTNYMLGQYDLAKQNLLGISEEDPNFPEAYYYLGVIAHREGNISKAKEYLMKVRETANNSTWGRKSSIYLMKL
ncbi:MAG: tetratricopeptide repeat protein, partial [Cetobacterium sp.]